MTILDKIIDYKIEFVNSLEIEAEHKINYAPLGFTKKLREQNKTAIIAEIKRGSPSKGMIYGDLNPEQVAKEYLEGGATAMSVLTDEKFFHGSNQDLIHARRAAPQLPIIRKDFIINKKQILEALSIGADCILLIVACLETGQLIDLANYALDLNLDILIEVHDYEELLIAEQYLELASKKFPTLEDRILIGVNNRDLKTFKVDKTNVTRLKDKSSNSILSKFSFVAESGIETPEDINFIKQHGINIFLIGETLLKTKQPKKELENLIKNT